jgi:excisionase family DNA binding protein
VANGKSGKTRPWPRMSAWLPPGLALGWLAVLATFVRGTGSLLAAWAGTVSLAVLLGRRRSAALPSAETADRPAVLGGVEIPSSGQADPASAPISQAAPGPDGPEQTGTVMDSSEAQEPFGEQEKGPAATGQSVGATMARDSSALRGPNLARASGPRPTARPAARPRPGESAGIQGLRIFTAAEVASVLRVDVDTIVRAISDGELPGNRVGSHWRVEQSALVRWLQGTYEDPTGRVS